MSSTRPTGTFCPGKDHLEIGGEVDGAGVDGTEKAGPSGSGIEFGGCGEEWGSASGALEGSRGFVLFDSIEVRGVGWFGSGVAKDVKLGGG